ncbi:TonB-dependent receptor [Alteromonas sp. KUL42]|uniref:TonB-dependent receptor n=1 Tax=Alteromonas sp. KUL42 TaxID=2480797 RepID=UPI000796C79D|nr:TonB-dependent receptor [Alteromonas sp. KUL42]KXJ60046.1 MAG: TonB-dependent receptor [Alteromonas sp. Nap_26]TAP35146.1 TonB-dependent receptor [Alteromonas sp. KUL42]GEA07436.1 TonB-dependent receptor [Alteromonas sp. KUL42]
MTHKINTLQLGPIAKRSLLGVAIASALHAPVSLAQEETKAKDDQVEVIEVKGFTSSLKASMLDKKASDVVYDGITAEDLGKFPDQNVAESLQRITGVAIDRSGGEGQFITVRGFGPDFNTVLVNGRQIATENQGRAFSFDTLPAELISGAKVYKSPLASMQEGGIGSTVEITTARPFAFDGFKAVASVKGMYEDISEETTPQMSGLITNTFADGKLGVLAAASFQQRKLQTNMLETRYWRPGVSITDRSELDNPAYADNAQFNGVYIPQNFDQIVDLVDRERTSGNLVVQYAPNDDMTLTLDGLYSKFEVDSDAHSVGHWFSDSNLDNMSFTDNGSLSGVTSTVVDGVGGATDFIRRRYGRDVEIQAFGANFEWLVNDNLTANIDISTSTAEDTSGGANFFTVVGYNNEYSVDYSGSIPSLTVAGGDAALQTPSLGRMHYNERNGFDTEDTISEYRADFTWVPDSDNAFYKVDFGLYYQDREKTNTRRFASACNVYCGYTFDLPDELLTVFTAKNYFGGVPNQWLTYDPEAFFNYATSDAAVQQIADATGLDFADVRATIDATNIANPQPSNDSFVVGEEVLSAYAQFYFSTEISDMPLDVNFGFRYSETDTSVDGTSQIVRDLQPIPNDPSDLNVVYETEAGAPVNETNSYSSLLPNVNVKLQLTDDLYLRYAYSETLTRPMMDDLVPVFNVTVSRPGNLQAQAGNTALQPYSATSWDVSLEWYYDDTSYFSAAAFNKEVEDFIANDTADESLFLDSGEYVFSVLRPRNGEALEVEGLELAWLHTLESGFGIQANATIVNSDAEFSLPGLGNSQNITLFYEKDAFQARVALNNRETFMQEAISTLGGTEPRFTETYTQVDMSVSYDVNETFTVFFEGINITDEELTRRGRLSEQFVQQVADGSRYAVGVRATF